MIKVFEGLNLNLTENRGLDKATVDSEKIKGLLLRITNNRNIPIFFEKNIKGIILFLK